MFENLLKEIQIEAGELDFNSLSSFESPAENKRKEWLISRLGKFTASESIRLMGYEDKLEFPEGAMTYATEKAIEVLTEYNPERRINSKSVEWGNLTENEACEVFMEKYNLEVLNYGSNQEMISKGDHLSCTPDGIIKDENGFIISGIETKCPDSKTHLFYLQNLNQDSFKKLVTKYYWQIQTAIYVTGAKDWNFVSYDPAFKNEKNRLLVINIKRNDDDINKFRRRLSQAIKIKTNIIEKYGDI
jgi:hypothetical protein